MCKGLHELGFWVCLPHVVIERAYSGALLACLRHHHAPSLFRCWQLPCAVLTSDR